MVGKGREDARVRNAFLRILVLRREENMDVSEQRLPLGRGVLNGIRRYQG